MSGPGVDSGCSVAIARRYGETDIEDVAARRSRLPSMIRQCLVRSPTRSRRLAIRRDRHSADAHTGQFQLVDAQADDWDPEGEVNKIEALGQSRDWRRRP